MTKNEKNPGKIIGGIIAVIILFAFLFWPSGDQNNSANEKQNLAKFDSEIINIGTSLTMYKIINRNNYPWHNVKITVNDYYSCWSRDVLDPGDSILVDAVTCNQFVVNYNAVESIWIEADEGAERYSLK